ncbi:MAG: ABC transporter ATP-binding protein [Thermoanaerobaculia bacterium]
MPTLEMDNVIKKYRTDLVETRALDEISLTVEEGEFVALSGPSGSGKTTFLNVAGLLDTFDAGTYRLDGVDVSRLDDRSQSRIRNEKIGFIFQGFNLIPDLDVFDNVDVPLRYRGLPARERRERIEKSLGQVGLGGRLRHLPSQLSGGQQQRVAIARALVGQPRLILADEPTGNLDTATAHEIMELLRGVNDAGTTILMVTHDPGCAAHSNRQLHILDGRLIDLREEQVPALNVTQMPQTAAVA